MIGLDLQRSPPLSSCFVQGARGEGWGDGVGKEGGDSDGEAVRGRRGSREYNPQRRNLLERGKEQRVPSHPILSQTMLT